MKLFDSNQSKSHTERGIFLDGTVDIQRYDMVKYPVYEKMNDRALALFWRPQEIDLSKDRSDYLNAGEVPRWHFDSNISRQIVLDSVQCRAPAAVFLCCASLPEVEDFIIKWSFYESIHSRSYTHILRNSHPNPTAVFDGVKKINEIMTMGRVISDPYDRLDYQNHLRALQHLPGVHYNEYEHKKAIWMALMASNALEGLRFFVSFSSAFRQAENKILVGNASIMRMICRDEMEHLKFTQNLIKHLLKEDPDYRKIASEMHDEVYAFFKTTVDDEKAWGNYLFRLGNLDGYTLGEAHSYMDFLARDRMGEIGMDWKEGAPTKNPISWIENWTEFGKKQAALQETENDAYLVGLVDFSEDSSDRTIIPQVSWQR